LLTRERRLKQLEAVKISVLPLIVRPAGKRFRVESPRALAGRVVSQTWIDASGADPVILDDIPESDILTMGGVVREL